MCFPIFDCTKKNEYVYLHYSGLRFKSRSVDGKQEREQQEREHAMPICESITCEKLGVTARDVEALTLAALVRE